MRQRPALRFEQTALQWCWIRDDAGVGKPEPARFRTWKGGQLWAGIEPVGTCAREQDRVSSWRGFKICLRFQIIGLCVCGMQEKWLWCLIFEYNLDTAITTELDGAKLFNSPRCLVWVFYGGVYFCF